METQSNGDYQDLPTGELLFEYAAPQSIESKIAEKFSEIMFLLNIPIDDSTKDTPKRVAKMYCREIFKGLSSEPPNIMVQENIHGYDQMIIQKNITVKSTCEHHFVPIIGNCHIAYIPSNKLIGLSKLNRIVDYYSRRPQVQEKLTHQIKNHLCRVLEIEDVAVIIDAEHFCIKMRGVENEESVTRTSAIGGVFTNDSTRAELFNSIGKICK